MTEANFIDGKLVVPGASKFPVARIDEGLNRVMETRPEFGVTPQTPIFDPETGETLYGSASLSDPLTAAQNVPSDAKNVLSDLAVAISDPVGTAKTLGKTVLGAGQKIIPGDAIGEAVGMPNYEAYPEAVADRYVERYAPSGNENQSLASNVYGSLINEPVTTLMDLSPVGLLRGGTPASPVNLVKNTAQATAGLLTPKKISEKLMESATKFRVNKARNIEDKNILNQEMLKRGLIPDADSALKVTMRKKEIGQEINDVLDAVVAEGGPNAMVPINRIFDGLEELKDKYRGVKLDAPDNRKVIDDIVEKLKIEQMIEGVDMDSAQLNVKQMNEFKKSVYDKLYDPAVPDITKPKEGAYSLLSRNAKEAVSDQVPKIDALNKEYGLLSNLEYPLEQAASRVGSNNVISFPGLIGGAAGYGATNSPVVAGLIAATLNPMNKARLANYLGAMKFQGMTPIFFENSVLPTLIEQGIYQPSQIQEAMDDFEKARAEELSE